MASDRNNSERPANVADMLFAVAKFLDAADSAFEALARLTNRPCPVSGDGVQRDLRALAIGLSMNPYLDEAVMDLLHEFAEITEDEPS